MEELNQKYGKEIFYYFNRRRSWNQKQQRWMGYERKRGALMELNRLLLGDDSTSYTVVTGRPQGVKYVITLDADTRLPMGGAKKDVYKRQ